MLCELKDMTTIKPNLLYALCRSGSRSNANQIAFLRAKAQEMFGDHYVYSSCH
jgi:hypothetical protein